MKQSEKNESEITKIKDHRIIVIGASAGGFEAIKTIVQNLPPDFPMPIFIVWHMAADVQGFLPKVLNSINTIHAVHANHEETIIPNRIYVAPPDQHLLIVDEKIILTRGPKENYFRPAIDPLFRSAAYAYGNKVIGIVLSGGLDDGTAGLWRIKHFGGIAIVQDPEDADVRSMPENAMREVAVDHCVPVEQIAPLLVDIVQKNPDLNIDNITDDKTKIEIDIAAGKSNFGSFLKIGELSPFTCPECQGVLSKITDGNLTRFRCHTGHAYSVDTLLSLVTDKIEKNLYNALRGVEETMMLLNHIGDHLSELNHRKLAALYFQKAKETESRAELLRTTIADTVQLYNEKIIREMEILGNQNEK